MLGSSALDVVLGLVFIYFVLSVVCTAFVETLSGVLGKRAKALYGAISMLLKTTEDEVQYVDHFFQHPLIAPFADPVGAAKAKTASGGPSYLPADKFTTALVDQVVGASPQGKSLRAHSFWAIREAVTEHIDGQHEAQKSRSDGAPEQRPSPGNQPDNLASTLGLDPVSTSPTLSSPPVNPTDPLRAPTGVHAAFASFISRTLAEVPDNTPDIDAARLAHLRQQVEDWYDDTMDRVGGWYKRWVQKVIIIVAVILVGAMNIDTVSIMRRLYNADKDTRNALVGAATRAAETDAFRHTTPTGDDRQQDALHLGVVELDRASIPMGWSQNWPDGISQWITKVLGLLVTILAVSLGAPFWFDMLSKLVNLRNTGAKPPTSADADSGYSDRPPALALTPGTSPPGPRPPATGSGEALAGRFALPQGYWSRTSHAGDWNSFSTSAAVPARAAALARAALLAYESTFVVQSMLKKWGRQNPDGAGVNDFKTFLQPGGTQAYIAAWPDFILVAFRGTQLAELADLVDDICCEPTIDPSIGSGKLHGGFVASLKERMTDLDDYLASISNPARPVYVTGHSLGAALATLYTGHLLTNDASRKVWLMTFGSPRVGDSVFAADLEKKTRLRSRRLSQKNRR